MYQQPNDETLLSLLGSNDIAQLHLDCGRRMSDKGTQQLVAALANCSSLKDFQLKCRGDEVEDHGAQILTALKNSPSNLTRLSLKECYSDWNGCAELGELIQSAPLEELDISQNRINDEGMKVLGRVLGGKASLKTLTMCTVGMDEYGEEFTPPTTAGWRAFFEFLKSPNCALEELELQWGHYDETARALTDAIGTNNITLKTLKFWNNLGLTAKGWCSFFTNVLGNCSALEHLDVHYSSTMNENLDNRIAVAFATALDGNQTLRKLDFSQFRCIGNAGNRIVMTSLTKLIFNDESLSAVIASNHALEELDVSMPLALMEGFPSLLRLNQNDNKNEVVQGKIRRYYNRCKPTDEDDELLMRELTKNSGDLDAKVVPFVLAWAGRDFGNTLYRLRNFVSTLLYRLLRRDPTVLSPEKGNDSVAGKRKRG